MPKSRILRASIAILTVSRSRLPASHCRRLPASGSRLPASGSQFTSQAKVQLQSGAPQRVVFLVEGDVAAAIRLSARLGQARAGSPSQVGDLGRRGEQDSQAEAPDRVAEVHVFGVQEKAFVEKPRAFG